MEVEVSSREEIKRDLITLDLLGGCTSVASKDLNLGLKPSICCHSELHPLDLNLPPDDGPKPAAVAPALGGSQSVCTIEKVKWALERAERESRGREMEERRRRRGQQEGSDGGGSLSPSPSSSSSITTASIKRRADGQEGGEEGSDGCVSGGGGCGSLVAAGCPSCLSYVLISKRNPRCPRCDSQVPLPAAPPPQKRPRIDLNFALSPL